MSWQLAAFTILGLALIGGFAWYERSRPDARIVALVATLAAFAALGRIAFAALPNVKPTTDIVLIAGYALGAGPGFVVGALAGLVSNFFFGQGPWTPWQMAGWGATGLIGAGLALITRGHIRRWPLAIVCAVVGFGFTVLQDVGDWVTYSDHSGGALGVYVGKGLGFDAVHAGGCLAFALAFGPALLRSISRFSMRLRVTWQAPNPAVLPLALALILGAWLAGHAGSVRAAASPAGYLTSAQNSDGGLGSAPGQTSSALFSGWAALGLAADGVSPQQVTKAGHSLTGYIEATAGSDAGSLERTVLALRAAGLPADSQVAAIERDIGRNGSVSNQTNLTAFAVLALRAAGLAPPGGTLGWLARQQDQDGGFNFGTAGGTSDVDDTGAVLEAVGSNARAVAFIERQQNRDGGFPSEPGAESNAQSTAWAVQGLLAAGAGGGSVDRGLAYLSALIAPDGHVRYSRSSDQTPVWVTGEAMIALARKPLPLAPASAGGSRGTSTPGSARPRRARHGTRVHRAHRARAVHRAPAPTAMLTLASDAGVAAALALAPVGLA